VRKLSTLNPKGCQRGDLFVTQLRIPKGEKTRGAVNKGVKGGSVRRVTPGLRMGTWESRSKVKRILPKMHGEARSGVQKVPFDNSKTRITSGGQERRQRTSQLTCHEPKDPRREKRGRTRPWGGVVKTRCKGRTGAQTLKGDLCSSPNVLPRPLKDGEVGGGGGRGGPAMGTEEKNPEKRG